MNLKEIRFPIEIKSVNHARSYILQKAYTNDLNSIKIIFELLDCTPEDLTGATASILLYMRDGSFFQDSATISGTEVIYTLTESQGNHAGVAQAQVIVKKTGTEWASSKEKFEIVAGLETAVATEVMIKDWTMLTAEARAFIDAAEAAEALRVSAESSRLTAEQGRATVENARVLAEIERENNENTRQSQESNRESNEDLRIALYDDLQSKLASGFFKGEKGDISNALEYTWNGTQLGVREVGTTQYLYVDLKGEKGDTGSIDNLNSQTIEDALGFMPISADDVQSGIILGEDPIENGWLFKPVIIVDERSE